MKEVEIPIEKIYVPSKHRSDLDPEKIDARAEDILSEGELRSPISIRRDGDRYVLVLVGDGLEFSVLGWQTGLGDPLDQALGPAALGDNLGDAQDLKSMYLGEFFQIW